MAPPDSLTADALAEFALARLDGAEAARILALLQPAGATREAGGNGSGTMPGEASASVPARLAAFYLARAAAGPDGPDRQRRLGRLEALLRQRLAAAAPAGTPGAAAAAEPPPDPPEIFAIRLAYRHFLGREARAAEIGSWLGRMRAGLGVAAFLKTIADSPEAAARQGAAGDLARGSDAAFVQGLYRLIEGRGAAPAEIEHHRRRLAAGSTSREEILRQFFAAALVRLADDRPQPPHDGLSCRIMGTDRRLSLADWQAQAADRAGLARARRALRPETPWHLPPAGEGGGIVVSVITSLYRGGAHIERFLDNIASQTLFDGRAELIIVDADSPEGEGEAIARRMRDHPDIVYRRINHRIGIYEAWNIALGLARGRYLTNANLDDTRRADSLEIQAGALEAHPWADVVYQDFYYTFDPCLSWEEAAAFGHRSELPLITAHNLLSFNSPHHAPMWRRCLHDELGPFDAAMRSAGDYEFWLRCLAAGRRFLKINEPHAVYYQNPQGLSTRADTRGVVESRIATGRHAHRLTPPAFAADDGDFARDFLRCPAGAPPAPDRYTAVQRALRDLARRHHHAAGGTGTDAAGRGAA